MSLFAGVAWAPTLRWARRLAAGTLLFGSWVAQGQAWNGVLAPARATDWTQAGLPGDVPPDAAWPQCGTTLAPYGSSGAPGSPSAINGAIAACAADHYVLLGAGDFYLSGSITLTSNVVLRGEGASRTRLHFVGGAGSFDCNGIAGTVCIQGSNTYGQGCTIGTYWPCPAPDLTAFGFSNEANWTGGFSQGSAQITLDDVTGIVPGVTPIVLDQCDTGFSGSTADDACHAPASGNAGAVTAASVFPDGGGSGYAVGDTGTIAPSNSGFGAYYGSGTATYQVSSVGSGGSVTGIAVTAGGFGYTFTNTGYFGSGGTPTTATTGSGTGLLVDITGVGNYDNGSTYIGAITMISADEAASNTQRPARSENQTVVPTAISGSGPYTVTLDQPIIEPNWAASQGPKAWWGSETIQNAGVEDVLLDQTGVTGSSCGTNPGCASAVVVGAANGVWVDGIASDYANYLHVNVGYATHVLVANNYLYYTANQGTESYGIGTVSFGGSSLFENNILQGITSPLNLAGTCSACVFAYNFAVNNAYANTAFLFGSNVMHSSADDYVLEEGNVGAGLTLDSIHGPHLFDTFFRNYFSGCQADEGVIPYQNTVPVIIAAFSRYDNLIGNVLGTAGYATTYECSPTSPSEQVCASLGTPAETTIYDLGWSHGDQLDYNNVPPEPNDPATAATLLRWGNYDTVNGAVQWSAAEVPSADPNYPNPVPASQALPASFYDGQTAAHPACGTGLPFWKNPATGACPPYPPIGPDVAASGALQLCTSGSYQWSLVTSAAQCDGGTSMAVVDGYAAPNPAMLCYLNVMGGAPDGTGPMLAFDRESCYGSDPAGSATTGASTSGSSGSAGSSSGGAASGGSASGGATGSTSGGVKATGGSGGASSGGGSSGGGRSSSGTSGSPAPDAGTAASATGGCGCTSGGGDGVALLLLAFLVLGYGANASRSRHCLRHIEPPT